MSPSVSLCVIARNEAATLVRCLRSASSLVQEMIVVDTGSTDETVALAEAEGATVFHFAWCDDFAAARNAALECATGEWILWLDADEFLLPESLEPLRHVFARSDVQAAWLIRQEMEREGQTAGFIEMRQLRVWRNDPALRFVGRCHPHFGTLLEERAAHTGQHTLYPVIRFRHSGYLPHLMPRKLERGIRLMQLELEERPGQLYYEIELGRALSLMNDPRCLPILESALEKVLAAKDSPHPPLMLIAALFERYLCLEPPDSPRLDTLLLLSKRWFPQNPPVLMAAAEAHVRRKEWDKAIPFLQTLIRCAETGQYDRSNTFDSALFGSAPRFNLAVCLHRLGRLSEAEAIYRRLAASVPPHPGAAYNLSILQQQKAAHYKPPQTRR